MQREPAVAVEDVTGDPVHLVESQHRLGYISRFADPSETGAVRDILEPAC